MTAAAVAALPFLVAAAVSDWRTRTARNELWLIVAGLTILALFDHSAGRVASGLTMATLGWLLYRWARFGGADAKAIMATGALYPTPIEPIAVLLAAMIGSLPWALLVSPRRIPFLIPYAAATTTWIVLAAGVVALPAP